jgi:hypothetical protein
VTIFPLLSSTTSCAKVLPSWRIHKVPASKTKVLTTANHANNPPRYFLWRCLRWEWIRWCSFMIYIYK